MRKCYEGQFFITSSKVFGVSGKVGGQVSMAPRAGALGLAAEWRPGEELEVHVEGVVQIPLDSSPCYEFMESRANDDF